MGLNSRYRVSSTEPMRIYAGDFDGNGRLDAIGTYYLQGREHPIASREELGRQWPGIKKQFTSYASYAQALPGDLLTSDQQRNSTVLRASQQQSVLLENTGTGFKLKPLPSLAQWAPIQSFVVDDVDSDGKLDILAVGNAYDTESVAGQYDAMTGLLLKGDGHGQFQSMLFPESGFLADGDCKSVVLLKGKNGPFYVVAEHKSPLRIFKKNPLTL